MESDLLERYAGQLHVDVSPHHPFGEISVESAPVSGGLADVGLEKLLAVLEEHFAGLEGSDWRLVSQVNGGWGGRTVVVRGVDGAHWGELKGVLDDGVPSWREVAFNLDVPGIVVGREFREGYCGPGVGQVWRGFHEGLLEATSATLQELPQLPEGGAPELVAWGSACGDVSRLRCSVELGVDGAGQRLGELREIVAGLPDEVVLSTLMLDGDGALGKEVRRADGTEPSASEVGTLGRRLDSGWGHGDARINGHVVGEA